MNNLNKKDLFIYRKFLNSMRDNLIDTDLDLYLPLIMDFIESKYESNENNNYDLEDFIQECFALFYNDKIKNILELDYFETKINEIYSKMNNEQKTIKEEIINEANKLYNLENKSLKKEISL